MRFRILRMLQDDPTLSQRDISRGLGVSLGGVNYCISALIEVGHIKAGNFMASDSKLKYAYLLTPAGVAEKAALTRRFLARKMREHEALRAEIEAVRAEFERGGGD